MDPNKPEPAPKGEGREITPLVIKDLELRSKMGKEKYGEALRAFNGRNPLVDAYQEALDLVQYLRQALEEQDQSDVDESGNYMRRTYQKDIDDIEDDEIEDVEVLRSDSKCDPSCFMCYPENEALRDRSTSPSTLMGGFLPSSTLMGSWRPAAVKAESIAQEAHRLVLGDRGEAYGHPIFDMTRSADMLTALLRNKLRPGVRLEAEDMGQAMICVKQSRHRNKPKRDNLVDTAGYGLTLQMIAEWREENPGVDPRDVFPES